MWLWQQRARSLLHKSRWTVNKSILLFGTKIEYWRRNNLDEEHNTLETPFDLIFGRFITWPTRYTIRSNTESETQFRNWYIFSAIVTCTATSFDFFNGAPPFEVHSISTLAHSEYCPRRRKKEKNVFAKNVQQQPAIEWIFAFINDHIENKDHNGMVRVHSHFIKKRYKSMAITPKVYRLMNVCTCDVRHRRILNENN